MKFKKCIFSSAFLAIAMCANAQETNEVEQLKRQLQQLQESFQKVQREQRQQIDSLTKKLDELQKQQTAEIEKRKAEERLAAESRTVQPPSIAPPTAEGEKPWRPTDPMRIGKRAAYVDLSFNGLFAAGASTADDIEGGTQLGAHDPNQRGFTVQNLEMTLNGAVDPYFRGQASLVFQIDSKGESLLEVEEAFAETTALPGNLQVKAGQFFTEFGRLNPTHPHAWSFVDQPLVSGRFLGGDGLRNPGARLSWLIPTPFYSELFFAAQNSHGATASSFRSAGHGHGGEESEEGVPFGFRHPDNDRGVRGLGDMLFTPRLATSFDITDNQVLLLGASGIFGPNSSGASGDTHTQIYGVDFTWKWKSPNHNAGFPFVAWQTEGMLRRYELGAFDWDEDGDGMVSAGEVVDTATGRPAVLSGETVTDHGFYSQLVYGFRKGWVAGLRFDYLTGNKADYEKMSLSLDGGPLGRDPLRAERWRLSPNLTWYPTEFSKVRLQYNYDDRRDIGADHSVWLQFEFLLGAHGAHKF